MDEGVSFCAFSVHCLGIGINQNCSRRKGHGFGCTLLVVVNFNLTIEKQAAPENVQVAGQRDFLDREICFLQYFINGQRHRRFKSLFTMPCQILGRIIIKAVLSKNQGSRFLIYIKDIARCRFVRHPYPSLLFPCNPAAWWQASSLPRAMSGNTLRQAHGICEYGSFP